MPQLCTTCHHPSRAKIDAALTRGQSDRSIALKFGLGDRAIARHRENHLSPALVAVAAKREERRLGSLVDELEAATAMAKRMLYQAEADGLAGQAQGWMREFRSCVELLLKATGQLASQPTQVVNIIQSPDVAELLTTAMAALSAERFAEARVVLADGWKRLGLEDAS
ncbi:MAG: hypothetical protein WBF51_01695 [Candidatus Dormiibacterota bacterium]